MREYIVTLMGQDGPILSEKALGWTSQDVYNMYREEYPIIDHPQILYIDVSEILKAEIQDRQYAYGELVYQESIIIPGDFSYRGIPHTK